MNGLRDIWAVVPVKEFDGAKQRLSAAHTPQFRSALAATMLEDVLAALAGARGLAGIVVASVDPTAERIARRHGARVLADGARGGHTGTVLAAARVLAAEGRGGLLTLPGDIPGATSAEIERLLDFDATPPCFAIVPAHDGRGSNAVLCMPPDLFPFSFGNDSFLPHLAAAERLGLAPRVLRLDGIGLDIDNPDDLRDFAARDWRTRTHALLAQHGMLPGQRETAA